LYLRVLLLPEAEVRSRVGKEPAVEDTVNWLRKNEPKLGDVDVPTMEANLSGVPMPKQITQ
jgi:hypothetical protein